MMRARKILCPVDFSAGSKQALRTALWLAKESDAEVVVTHVWYLPPMGDTPAVMWSPEVVSRLCDDADRELVATVTEARKSGATRVSPLFLTGSPWDRIVYTLESDLSYDLAVIGTRGRSSIAQIMLGSVAENIARRAPCSVLLVPQDRAAGPFEHALAAVDFSPSSRYAAELATAFVGRGGKGMTLAHVVELPTPLRDHPNRALLDPDSSTTRGATEVLERWAKELRDELGATVQTRLDVGHPTERILALLADDPSYDLVVTGSHGRGSLRRLLLGSVASQIVRHARKPVLVARRRNAS
jgi:nucleotide-binding universal stress UspA family protein